MADGRYEFSAGYDRVGTQSCAIAKLVRRPFISDIARRTWVILQRRIVQSENGNEFVARKIAGPRR
jgi:hypothetical protein